MKKHSLQRYKEVTYQLSRGYALRYAVYIGIYVLIGLSCTLRSVAEEYFLMGKREINRVQEKRNSWGREEEVRGHHKIDSVFVQKQTTQFCHYFLEHIIGLFIKSSYLEPG